METESADKFSETHVERTTVDKKLYNRRNRRFYFIEVSIRERLSQAAAPVAVNSNRIAHTAS
jgi:hypothetical protein